MATNSIDVIVRGDYNDAAINRAIKDLQRLQASSETLTSKMNNFGEEMKATGQKIAGVGKSLTLGVTLPIVGIGAAAIALQADFETSMNSLQVNAAASGDQMQRLNDLALKMGADTVFSAGEAAQSMLELSKGGLSVADIEAGALAATMNLAATEGIALEQAAVIMSNAMNTFGIDAKDTAAVVDILAAAAVASTASIEDLAGGLKFVGSTASTMGIPLDDVVTALAALNSAGIDSSTAGTSLNRMLLGLVPTTDKAGKIMDNLGLNFTDATGAIKPFEEVVRILVDTFGDLSTAERIPFLKGVFGVEGMRAANILIEEGIQGFNDLSTSVNKSGIAADLANARMSGTAGAIEGLKGSVESAAIVIGQALAPTIQKIAGVIQELVNRFAALPESTQKMIIIFAALAAAIGPVLIVVGMLITAIGSILAVMSPAVLVIAGIVAAVALLAVGFAYLWKNSETLRTVVGQVFETIKSVITGVVSEVQRVLNENRQTIDTIKNAFQQFADFLMTYVVPILVTFVGNYLKALFMALGEILKAIINIIGAFVQFVGKLIEVGAFLITWTTQAVTTVQEFFAAISTAVSDTFNTIKDFIAGVFQSIYNNIVNTIRDAVNFVVRGLNRIINAWNGLSFTIPQVTVPFVGTFGGQTVGVPALPNIPELAEGGIVTAPTLALIGEKGPEAVIPLRNNSGPAGTNITINVTAGMGTDGADVGRQIVEALKRYERRNGPVPITVT